MEQTQTNQHAQNHIGGLLLRYMLNLHHSVSSLTHKVKSSSHKTFLHSRLLQHGMIYQHTYI